MNNFEPNPQEQVLGIDEEESAICSESAKRVNAVARVFKMTGWLGAAIYTPMVVTCIVSLIIVLLGNRNVLGNPNISPSFLAFASTINGVILIAFILYIKTGQRISERDYSVHQRARLMSILMMLGFPIFTVVGFICLRYLNRDFTAVVGCDEATQNRTMTLPKN